MHKFGVVVTAVAIRTADRTPVLLFCARQTWIKVFFFSKPQLLPGEGFWGGRISSARHEHPSSLWIEGIHIQQEGEPWLLLSFVADFLIIRKNAEREKGIFVFVY